MKRASPFSSSREWTAAALRAPAFVRTCARLLPLMNRYPIFSTIEKKRWRWMRMAPAWAARSLL